MAFGVQSYGQSQGDILITEFMANPSAVADGDGEYVELYNTTASSIDINGWTLKDDGSDNHVIDNANGTTIVPAYGFLVLGLGDGTYNGRDYLYSSFTLGNSADEIVLQTPAALEICRVNYTDGDPFGASISVELDNISNNSNGITLETNYVASTTPLLTDMGSPGLAGNTIGTGGPDTDAPVATWDPTNTSTTVAIESDITITFDEPILNTVASEITDANVAALLTLKETDENGADVAFTATIDATKQIITINPDANLAYNQAYFAVVAAVEDASGNETDGDTIAFTTLDASAKSLVLTNPVGGEKFYSGGLEEITWNSSNVTSVNIDVFIPENDAWESIFTDIASDGSVYLIIPSSATYAATYRLAITDVSDSTVADTSDFFTVVPVRAIEDIQSENDGDTSIYEGDFVATIGTVTYVNGTAGYFIQDSSKAWNGIYVVDGVNTPAVGDSVAVEGKVEEDHGLTRLNNVVTFFIFGSGRPLPTPVVVSTNDIDESYECVMVRIINATVTNDDAGYGQFEINDGSGALLVDDDFYYHSAKANENISIIGMGYYSFGAFKILPLSESDILSASDTLTSIYTVDNTANTITNVPFSHDLAAFEANIHAPDSATMDVYDADGTTPATAIDDSKLVVVLAADGVTTRTYTVDVNNALNVDTTLMSDVYTIDNAGNTITGVPFATDLATFEANINPSFIIATFETYNSDSITVATELLSGCVVIVTAENGSTKTYTITIDPASDDATVSSTLYTVENTEETITGIPFGTTLAVFESNLTPAIGATFVTYLADGITTATDLQTGYVVIVTAQDNIATKTYTITIDEELKDLYFSEYVEGSSSNKALEIYNPNTEDVSLSTYVLLGSSNAAEDWENIYAFPEGHVVPAGDVYVIVDDASSTEMQAVADWITAGFEVGFNGNDARGLSKIVGEDTITVDVIGDSVNVAGDMYTVAGIASGMLDHTLVRKSKVRKGNTDWTSSAGTDAASSEWVVNDIDYIANLGSHTVMPASSDASLSRVDVNGSELSGFDPGTLNYTHVLAYGTTDIPTVTVQTNHTEATYDITDATNLTGTEVERTTSIAVTAEDGTLATYKIVFSIGAASTDATLSDLKVDNVTVTGFAAGTYNYEIQLAAGTTTIPIVTATANDANADAVVTQATDLSGDVATRTATIVVTAQDNDTELTYSVLFVRASATEMISLDRLQVYPTTVEKNIHITNAEVVDYVQIINLTGSVTMNVTANGADKFDIDLTELKAGMYILKAVAGTDVSVHRFIKK